MATVFGQERTEALDVVAVQLTVLDRAMKCTGWDVVTVLLVWCAMFLERTELAFDFDEGFLVAETFGVSQFRGS